MTTITFWMAVVVGPALSAARDDAAAADTVPEMAPVAGIDSTVRELSVPMAICPAWTLKRASVKRVSSGSDPLAW